MKEMIKRIWALALSFALVFTSIGTVEIKAEEIWASGQCGENITWELNSEGVLTLSGEGEMYDYSLGTSPSWKRNYASQIQKLHVSEGITKIGAYAFYDCVCLQDIELPNSLKIIGEYAFYFALNLIEIDIPSSVEEIGRYALENTKLKRAEITENVKVLGHWPFGTDCSDVTVETSKNITIYEDYFIKSEENASNKIIIHKVKTLTPVVVDNQSERDIYVDGEVLAAGKSMTSTAQEVTTNESDNEDETAEESNIISGTAGDYGAKWEFNKESQTLTLYGDRIEILPSGEFVNKVRHIVFSEGVRDIQVNTSYPNVEDVYISSSVVNVYKLSFISGSRKLKEVIVSEDNHYYKSIDGNLYSGKNRGRLTLERYAPGKTEEKFIVPSGVNSLDEDAFDWAKNLKEITLPKGVGSLSLPINGYITKVNVMNPDCVITKTGNKSNLVVYAYKGSQVEEFCNENGINFQMLDIKDYVSHISIVSGPTKTVFKQGTRAVLNDIKVKVTFMDETTQVIESGFTVGGVDTSVVGTHAVLVDFNGVTTYFDVQVVEIEENEYIKLNEEKIVALNSGKKTKEIFFTALLDGVYTINSTGEYDVYATLFNMNYTRLGESDDNGEDINFLINKQLTAGKTYIIRISYYSTSVYTSDYALPVINVKLKELIGECTHIYDSGKDVSPTCTSQGYTTYACTICGNIKKDNFVDKIHHEYETIKVIEPTCEENGYLIYRCRKCGYRTGAADKENTYLGHQYLDIVISPTFTEYGYTIHECEICDKSYKSDWVEPLGFDVNPTEKETTEQVHEETTTVKEVEETSKVTNEEVVSTPIKIKKPIVKGKRVKEKIKLTLKCKTKEVKYQIFVKKNGTYKRIKTTAKNSYIFKHKLKCYIKVRCVVKKDGTKHFSKYRKLKVK